MSEMTEKEARVIVAQRHSIMEGENIIYDQEALDEAEDCLEKKLLNEKLRVAVSALESYAGCGDGCTCGDGWSHKSADEALAKIEPKQGTK